MKLLTNVCESCVASLKKTLIRPVVEWGEHGDGSCCNTRMLHQAKKQTKTKPTILGTVAAKHRKENQAAANPEQQHPEESNPSKKLPINCIYMVVKEFALAAKAVTHLPNGGTEVAKQQLLYQLISYIYIKIECRLVQFKIKGLLIW